MKYIFLLVPDTALGKVGRPWCQHFPFHGRCFIWYFMVTGYYLVRFYWLFMPGVSETSSQWSFHCDHRRDVGQCSQREHPHSTSGFGSGFWRLCIISVVCHWRLKCVIQGRSGFVFVTLVLGSTDECSWEVHNKEHCRYINFFGAKVALEAKILCVFIFYVCKVMQGKHLKMQVTSV